MYNSPLRLKTALIISLLGSFCQDISAQKAGLEVTRTSAIDRTLAVTNVSVDNLGRKWAANSKGVFQIKAADFGTQRTIPAGEKSVLAYRGGNADFNWSDAAFRSLVKTECEVTAAWYDDKTTTLWLGTDVAGLFQFKTTPELQLVDHFTTANSKLKSDNITIIYQDKTNRLWVGCDQGIMYGAPGRWKAELRGFDIQRVQEYGNIIYVLGGGSISKGIGGEKWSDLALDDKKLEGDINDFGIDINGKMWIVSGLLTRFDLVAGTYETFSGPEYYTSEFGNVLAIDEEAAVWVGTNDKGLYLVDKASAMTLNAYVDQPVTCSGNGKDAILLAKVTGGVAPYTFSWSGGLSGENPKNVAPGVYSITVTDSKGKSRIAEVPVPDSRLRIKARQKKPVSATGQTDGAAEVDIESNASGLLISWDNGETMAVATKLSGGIHTVTVTDPKGCATSVTVTIGEKNPPLSVSIVEDTKIKCAGDKLRLSARPNGGKAPYKITWNNPGLSGDAAASVSAGEYQVTVTDAAGVSATATLSVKQPEALVATAIATAPASTGASNGKALAQPKGGTANYTFQWDNGETASTAVGLSPGQHKVTVSDANGCTTNASVTISENIQPIIIYIAEKTKIGCHGDKVAALVVAVKGGKAPYTYAWSDPSARGETPTNLAAGDYRLTVTDATGATMTDGFSIKQPETLSLTAMATAPASTGNSDGKAMAEPKGGTGIYKFQWDNGERTAAARNLAPGQHNVMVMDANGCSITVSVQITENILPLTVNISEKSKVNCAGGKTASLAVNVNGGKSPYKYTWSDPAVRGEAPTNLQAGDYRLTVTDATGTTSVATQNVKQPDPLSLSANATSPASTGNNDGVALAEPKGGSGGYIFQWDDGESSATAVKLPPGQHSVTVTDTNGCMATASFAVSENILPLAVSISEKNIIKCAGEKSGSLSIQVKGGKGPYKYTWNDPSARGDAPENLQAGDYQVTVTDATGKTTTATQSIKQPDALSLNISAVTPASTGNSDGKATAEPKGGAGAYKLQWDNGETSAAAEKLPPGQHSVTATDANGCTVTATVTLSENILPLAAVILEKNKIKCAGEKTALAVQVTGGKPPYTYAWNNPALNGEQSGDLTAGEYTVTVTDKQGTSQVANAVVISPEPLSVELIRNIGATTERSADGKAQVTVKGGVGKYNVVWDTKQTGLAVSKMPLGPHNVKVTDANGCSQSIDFETEKRVLPELTGKLESGQTIRMRLLNFSTDSSSLRPESLPMLDELYDFMMENGSAVIEIGGHTNNQPTDAFADQLSTARAKSVADYLFAKGVDPKRVVYKGYGKRLPLVPNTSPEGRKTNQRVEIKIVKITN